MTVQELLARLATLKRAPWQGNKAPHKPVLLLAVADCPNLHTAFDAGLISLSDDCPVFARDWLVENSSAHCLKALEGLKIRLPIERLFWLGRKWVRWQWLNPEKQLL